MIILTPKLFQNAEKLFKKIYNSEFNQLLDTSIDEKLTKEQIIVKNYMLEYSQINVNELMKDAFSLY